MRFRTTLITLIAVPFFHAPMSAQTAQEKKETCEFDANDLKLEAAERQRFMARCLAYEERAARQATPKPGRPLPLNPARPLPLNQQR